MTKLPQKLTIPSCARKKILKH